MLIFMIAYFYSRYVLAVHVRDDYHVVVRYFATRWWLTHAHAMPTFCEIWQFCVIYNCMLIFSNNILFWLCRQCLLIIFTIWISLIIINTVKLLIVGAAQLTVPSTELLHKRSSVSSSSLAIACVRAWVGLQMCEFTLTAWHLACW